MKIKTIFIGVSVFLWMIFVIPETHASSNLLITAVQINATDNSGKEYTKDEFFEITNNGDTPIDLKNISVRKIPHGSNALSCSSETDSIISKGNVKRKDVSTSEQYSLSPQETLRFWHPDANNLQSSDLVYSQKTNSLSPDNTLELCDGNLRIDAVGYGNASLAQGSSAPDIPSNFILARKISGGHFQDTENNADDFSLKNPQTPPPSPDPAPPVPPTSTVSGASVRINEVFPDPSAKGDAGEFIELYNFGIEPTNISGWKILDAAAMKKKSEGTPLSENDYLIFPNIPIIDSGKYFVAKDTDSWFHITLNNTNETLSLFDKSDTLIDSMHFDKTTSNVSLNYTASGWRGGTPTPGEINQPNNLPETVEKVPDEGYKGVEINFDAQGKDSDNDALKYTWDFGDGHKSYKEQTTHTYEENGTYTVTLKTTDGKDDTLETFTIKIESMPRKDVRITSLLPNPTGNDTGNEWIIIENREKKSVNLKDYSIATGWKKLSNHPIREDFIIKPYKEAKLTQEFSSFSLPNQKGRIELRAPDGKVLQKIEYKLDKPAVEDAVYHKEKGSAWKWITLTKKISVPSQKEVAINEKVPPFVLGTSTEKPEEIIQPIQEDTPIEPIKTKSDQISLEPNRPLPQDILAYGMQVQTPDFLTLTIPEDEKTSMLLASTLQPSPLLVGESLFSKINTSLNNFLNSVE